MARAVGGSSPFSSPYRPLNGPLAKHCGILTSSVLMALFIFCVTLVSFDLMGVKLFLPDLLGLLYSVFLGVTLPFKRRR